MDDKPAFPCVDRSHQSLAQPVTGGTTSDTTANLPRKVARSMAFAGEPVDQAMLEAWLEQLKKQFGD